MALAIRPDRLFSSPYRRARQTAEPLTRCVAPGALELLEKLADADCSQLLAELGAQLADGEDTVALVGREPYLSRSRQARLPQLHRIYTTSWDSNAKAVVEGWLKRPRE